MSALPEASTLVALADDDDLVHVVCCNPDIADCGRDVSGRPVLPEDTPTTCRICAIAEAEDLPCADPECPYRDEVE